MDQAFRKIEIDIYDEDVLRESKLYEATPCDPDPAQVLEDAEQRQVAVRSFLEKCAMNMCSLLYEGGNMLMNFSSSSPFSLNFMAGTTPHRHSTLSITFQHLSPAVSFHRHFSVFRFCYSC